MKELSEKETIRAKLEIAKKESLITKVFLFVPNLVGYTRITCLIIAFWYLKTDYKMFMAFYIASYLLDAVDGVAARYFKQCSKFGAMLDMITDRTATISLLVTLGYLDAAWFGYYLSMALIDLVSHWYQMYSSVLWGADSHKAGAENENFLVYFYYKFPGVLFISVLGSEAYTCGLYLRYHNPAMFDYEIIKLALTAANFIFHFKQLINVAQLYTSLCRVAEKDCVEIIDKRIAAKAN